MKQFNFTKFFCVTAVLFAFTTNAVSQTSLIYEEISASFKASFTFSTGDIIYFSAMKKTNTAGTCPGSNTDGIARTYRIQEDTNPFILELKSTALNAITIYGKPKDTGITLGITKIEVATSKDGAYEDITSTARINNSMIGNVNCGYLSASGLNIPINSFVRISVTDASLVYKGVNISEFYITSGGTSLNTHRMAEKTLVAKKCYSSLGNEVSENALGLMIEKQLYDDGSIVANKIFKR